MGGLSFFFDGIMGRKDIALAQAFDGKERSLLWSILSYLCEYASVILNTVLIIGL